MPMTKNKESFLIKIEPKPSVTSLTLQGLHAIGFDLDERKVAAAVLDQYLAEEAEILIDDIEGQIKSAVRELKDGYDRNRK